jgi:hypothetical protein
MTEFTTIFWSLLVPSIVVFVYADIAMKIRVNDRLPAKERYSWASRNSWAVARKYREFYPNSYLPLIGKCSFLLCTLLGAAFAVNTLW